MKPQKRQTGLQKLWWFIWEDDSWASWVVNIVLAFVIIKYGVYPGLGLVFGTTHPIVAVVSSSMEQRLPFDGWWKQECCSDAFCVSKHTQEAVYRAENIEKSAFLQFPFPRGFNKGDIMVLKSPTRLRQGDVLVFMIPSRPDPIIHRIIAIKENAYKTKGDNNCNSAEFEEHIAPKQAVGKAVFRIPYLGWIKILFVELLNVLGVS